MDTDGTMKPPVDPRICVYPCLPPPGGQDLWFTRLRRVAPPFPFELERLGPSDYDERQEWAEREL